MRLYPGPLGSGRPLSAGIRDHLSSRNSGKPSLAIAFPNSTVLRTSRKPISYFPWPLVQQIFFKLH
jgi:hypothetical protein